MQKKIFWSPGVLAKEVNHWASHLVLFYCRHDGSIWCNHLHISFLSMEMEHHSNFPFWLSPCILICSFAVLCWLR
ncbi:hypothetical protein Pint_29108 [Pistacia integerrima]|uniref:Uncharacterized protein n=1 Tax=Pistacia integerrima TaxID=434235 RepID=A0ACC0WXD7_9ROSI|nr:hypothetical protein Pint_29108 [Pistacia integerrima]